MVYSLSSGLPVLLIATVGSAIRQYVPNVMSFSDYVLRVCCSSSLFLECMLLLNCMSILLSMLLS